MRSSSSCKCLSNSATFSVSFKRRPSEDSFSIIFARSYIKAISLSMIGRIPGRRTLIATSCSFHSGCLSVARKTPKWTCATEALATGVASKLINTSSIGWPSALSIRRRDSSLENGGTWSCSLANSLAISSGNKSRRVESTCPNFTKIGPSASSVKRMRSPLGKWPPGEVQQITVRAPLPIPGLRISRKRGNKP